MITKVLPSISCYVGPVFGRETTSRNTICVAPLSQRPTEYKQIGKGWTLEKPEGRKKFWIPFRNKIFLFFRYTINYIYEKIKEHHGCQTYPYNTKTLITTFQILITVT